MRCPLCLTELLISAFTNSGVCTCGQTSVLYKPVNNSFDSICWYRVRFRGAYNNLEALIGDKANRETFYAITGKSYTWIGGYLSMILDSNNVIDAMAMTKKFNKLKAFD
jgi:hypothetical protein